MYLSMKLSSEKQGIEIVEEGLLDSGATEKFIDQSFVKQKGLKTKLLDQPIKVFNVDGTPNKKGTIKSYKTWTSKYTDEPEESDY